MLRCSCFDRPALLVHCVTLHRLCPAVLYSHTPSQSGAASHARSFVDGPGLDEMVASLPLGMARASFSAPAMEGYNFCKWSMIGERLALDSNF